MDELFRQLAFINALLGGFAIAFLSTLLTTASRSRVVNWMVAVVTASAACFILSALGATFSAVVAADVEDSALPGWLWNLHQAQSMLFLGGTVLLFVSLGLGGWLRSRGLGMATATIASAALVAGYFIIQPFMR